MLVHWAYFGCSKEDEERLQRHWEDHQRRLLSRVEALAEDPAELEMVVDRQDESPQWQIQSALHLPVETLAVGAAQNEPGDAVDNAVSGLIAELDRLDERPPRETIRREGLHGIVPILDRCREQQRSDVFFTWLAPVVGSLDSHVRRELRIRELETNLATGQVAPADVLDEVLLRAYDRFERRPEKLPLDLWLMQLCEEVLEELCRTLADQSLDAQVAKPEEEPAGRSRDNWTEWATFSETIELGDMLPARPDAHVWDELDLEIKNVETDRMLARIPRQQRQALVLTTVYGYSPVEIADFQNRAESDVKFDIERGRHELERHFLEAHLRAHEEEMEPTERRTTRRGMQ